MNAKKLLMTAAVVGGMLFTSVQLAEAIYIVNEQGTFVDYYNGNTPPWPQDPNNPLADMWLFKATPNESNDGDYASFFGAFFSNEGKGVTIKWGTSLDPDGELPDGMEPPELKFFALKAGSGYAVWDISNFQYSEPEIFATTVGITGINDKQISHVSLYGDEVDAPYTPPPGTPDAGATVGLLGLGLLGLGMLQRRMRK